MANWNNLPNTLNGPGYTVQMPPGFMASPTDPFSGAYFAWPPGSTPPPNSPALIWMKPVMQFQFPMLQQQYFNFDNPWVANFNAMTLGLLGVTQIAPLRTTTLNGANALIREFDAISSNQQPIRMSAMLLQGPTSALQCIVGINSYQWVQFAGPAMQFVGNLHLAGTFAAPGEVRSVIDKTDFSKVQLQFVNADCSVAPIMSVPTSVQGAVVYQIRVEAGGSIKFGDVKGTNVQIGDHNNVAPA